MMSMRKNEICKYFIFIPVTCVAILVIILGYTVLDKNGFLQYPVMTEAVKPEVLETDDVKIVSVPEKLRKGESLIDINKATAEDFMRLPGIGKAKATAIIKQRIKMNGFYSIGDLACTDGISTKTLEALSEFITISEYEGE